jgi:pimeloyl-ACP methyl ester carboxylesterase
MSLEELRDHAHLVPRWHCHGGLDVLHRPCPLRHAPRSAGSSEVEPINFLPRITAPVLMLNGQYDHYFPVETAQRPMFRLLGTPADKKRQVIAEGGHFIPRPQLVKETLDWLDRYLGPTR